MTTISRDELLNKLRNIKGTTAIGITTVTKPDMNKKVNGEPNPYYGRVSKWARRSCMIGFKYTNSVNNQREREDKDADFVAQPRKWGVRIAGTPLVEHNGKFYLECKVERVLESHYFLDDDLADDEVVEPYLVKRSQSGRQGVDREVILIDPALENIESIVMFGEVFDIIKEEVLV
jgi:hypothetical protein